MSGCLSMQGFLAAAVPPRSPCQLPLSHDGKEKEEDDASVCSADEALLEMLCMQSFSLATIQDDEPQQDSSSCPTTTCCSPCNDKNHKILAASIPIVTRITPPAHCQRPHTPNQPLLLETRPQLLSRAQCQYIIDLGYRASNNGGQSYGPTYVQAAVHGAAAHNTTTTNTIMVQLAKPNHHKVCVFTNDMVSRWISTAIRKNPDINKAIVDWCQENHFANAHEEEELYRINPRLRLLRYDAVDQDVFLPHYDATTTSCANGHDWTSRLTILLYLNDGDGINFDGGATLYLNALHPQQDAHTVCPQAGKMVIFDHELYHASQPLEYNAAIKVPRHDNNKLQSSFIVGGSKFVLRSDVFFRSNVLDEANPSASLSSDSSSMWLLDNDKNDDDAADRVVSVRQMVATAIHFAPLADILQSMDLLDVSLASFWAAGRNRLQTMLLDLGAEIEMCRAFLDACQEEQQQEALSS